MREKGVQAFRLRANAPRGLRGLRGNRGGKVSTSLDSLAHLEVSKHTLSPLVPLVPLVPLSDSWRSERAQSTCIQSALSQFVVRVVLIWR